MRLRTSLSCTALLLFRLHQVWAAAPIPFTTLFRNSDTVVVGVIESAVPIPASDVAVGLEPKREFRFLDDAPAHACELRIHVNKVIKAPKILDPSSALSVLSFLPLPSCSPTYDGIEVLVGLPALWLLRTDRGFTRTTLDDRPTVYPTHAWSALSDEALRQWSAADSAVAYLVLKPGMIVSESSYPYSDLPIQMADLVGFTKFLTVYRTIFMESSEYHRGLISLSAASFGHCLALAERTAKVLEPKPSMFMQQLFDHQLARRTDEVDSKLMSWATKEALLSALGGPDKAIDELTFRACSSGRRVKTRAKELLSIYFGIESSALPCIPCE